MTNLNWLKAFSKEELIAFLEELILEVVPVEETNVDEDTLPNLVIHEWYESALALQSEKLAIAFQQERDEVMLTRAY